MTKAYYIYIHVRRRCVLLLSADIVYRKMSVGWFSSGSRITDVYARRRFAARFQRESSRKTVVLVSILLPGIRVTRANVPSRGQATIYLHQRSSSTLAHT